MTDAWVATGKFGEPAQQREPVLPVAHCNPEAHN